MFSSRFRSSSKIDFLASTDLTMSDGSTSLMSNSMNLGRVANGAADEVAGAGVGGSGGGERDADEAGDKNGDRVGELSDEIDVFGDGCCGVVALLHVSWPLSSVSLAHLSKMSSRFLPRLSVDGLDAMVSESLDADCIDCGFDGLSGCCLPGGGGIAFAGCGSVNGSCKN